MKAMPQKDFFEIFTSFIVDFKVKQQHVSLISSSAWTNSESDSHTRVDKSKSDIYMEMACAGSTEGCLEEYGSPREAEAEGAGEAQGCHCCRVQQVLVRVAVSMNTMSVIMNDEWKMIAF